MRTLKHTLVTIAAGLLVVGFASTASAQDSGGETKSTSAQTTTEATPNTPCPEGADCPDANADRKPPRIKVKKVRIRRNNNDETY